MTQKTDIFDTHGFAVEDCKGQHFTVAKYGFSPVKSRLSSLSAIIPVIAIGKKSPNGLNERFRRVSDVSLASSGGTVDI